MPINRPMDNTEEIHMDNGISFNQKEKQSREASGKCVDLCISTWVEELVDSRTLERSSCTGKVGCERAGREDNRTHVISKWKWET